MSTTVLAIAAHPGDAFFSMGAVVARHIHNGGRGVFLSLSLGERGHPTIEPARYGQMQRDAARKAAALLGAECDFLAYRDAEIPAGDAIALEICDRIRRFKPHFILTHWQGSWHKDHQNTFFAVRDAALFAGLRSLERQLPAHSPRRIFYPENWEDAAGFRIDFLLDIGPVYDRWVEACEIFPMWRGETGLIRYRDFYCSLAAQHGALAGCRYAVALMRDPQERPPRLERLEEA